MSNKALFLDRDGIINIDHGYVHTINEFEFVEGIFDVCRHAISLGYKIIVITNQAGIARGYYQIADFEKLTTWMIEQFRLANITITDVFYCPHHPKEGVNEFAKSCECRKPAPGMLIQAKKKHHIDFNKSIFIGDKVSDIQAADAVDIPTKILVSSKYHQEETITAHHVDEIIGALPFIN